MLKSVHAYNENQWNNLVIHADQGTLFHRHEWLAAVEEGLDRDPRHVVVSTDSNPVALMPNFVQPFQPPLDAATAVSDALGLGVMKSADVGFGGPIVARNEAETVERLFDALEATITQRILYHRISTYHPGHVRYGQYLESRGYEAKADLATFLLDLSTGWETILETMDRSRRKDVRRAHEQEYRVEIGPLDEDIRRTHEMYAKNTERVGGTVKDFSFFRALQDRLPERVRVFTAVVDGETVGRYVYLLDRENDTLHHWLSAIPDRDCYSFYPAELMHSRAIKWGIERGFEEYSFGRAGAHFDNGVFRFKNQYGAEPVRVLRWERGPNPLVWPAFKYGRRLVARRES